MREIFISYRIEDSKPWAVLVAQSLSEVFGADHVFLDKDTLHAGDWREQIGQAIRGCRVFLLIIGHRWLTLSDPSGIPRLNDPQDVHRWEIATALSAPGVSLVPLTVDGASMPDAARLPAELARLVEHQALDLADRQDRRAVDLQALIRDLHRLTGLPCRTPAPARSRSVRLAVMAAATLLLSAVAWTGFYVHDGVQPTPMEGVLVTLLAWLLVVAVRTAHRRLTRTGPAGRTP